MEELRPGRHGNSDLALLVHDGTPILACGVAGAWAGRGKGVMTIDLSLGSRNESGWTVVDVKGEVDLFTAPKFREHVVGLVEKDQRKIAVNLRDVEFMDSTGLGVLVGVLRRLKERDGELALLGPQGSVLRVLTVTGLNRVFPIYDSLEQAIAAEA
jgi:anti-sigma B factor antagonist